MTTTTKLNAIATVIKTRLEQISQEAGYYNDIYVLDWHEARWYLINDIDRPVLFIKPATLTLIDIRNAYLPFSQICHIECYVPINTALPCFATASPVETINNLIIDVLKVFDLFKPKTIDRYLDEAIINLSVGQIDYQDPDDGSNVILVTIPLIVEFTEQV
jgi:hypothetical protein